MTVDGVLTEYAYDSNGDIKTENVNGNQTTYAFDGFRRLSSINMSNGRVQQNYYNTENLRTGLVENGKFRGMLYSGSRVIAEYDGQDALLNRYHIGKGIVASENANGLHYFHQNGHGDVSTITNTAGQAVEKYSYSAFGELTSLGHNLDNRFLYSGEQLDPLTGDYYLRARMYRPSIGRFLAEDVYRGDGMNLYAYVSNNPLIYVDPSGWGKEGAEGEDKGNFWGTIDGLKEIPGNVLNQVKGLWSLTDAQVRDQFLSNSSAWLSMSSEEKLSFGILLDLTI